MGGRQGAARGGERQSHLLSTTGGQGGAGSRPVVPTVFATGSTLYPALRRLEAAGFITGQDEDIDPAVAGRPARVVRSASGMRWAFSVFVQARRTAKADRRARPLPRGAPQERPQSTEATLEEAWESITIRRPNLDRGWTSFSPRRDGTLVIMQAKYLDRSTD